MSVSYARPAMHKRLRRTRGRAAGYLCDGCCGSAAHDWAQVHGTSGHDIWRDYVPLCRSCHIRYDHDSRWNPESLAKWRASAGPAIAAAWTPERRAAQSEYAKRTRRQHPIVRDPVTGRIVDIA